MDRLLEAGAYTFKGNALHNGVEESFHEESLGFLVGNAARLKIEQGFLFEFADGRSVRTADIVGKNFQSRDGVSACVRTEDEITVGLVAICLCCTNCDINHALPD